MNDGDGAREPEDEEHDGQLDEEEPAEEEPAEDKPQQQDEPEEADAAPGDPAQQGEPGETADTLGEWLSGKPLPETAHVVLGLLVPAAIGFVNMWRVRAHTVDDAFISYRYARNLARGLGLVYNEGERIEGYTNFLWTLILGAGVKVGIDPDSLAKVLGAGFAFGAMAILFVLERRIRPYRVLPCCSTWLLASTGTFMGYAVFGLETTMFAFMVLAGALVMMDEERRAAKVPWSGLVFGVAGITRPEAPMYLGLFMLFLAGPALAPLERFRGRFGVTDPDRDRLPVLLLALVATVSAALIYRVLAPPSGASVAPTLIHYAITTLVLSVLVLGPLLALALLPRALLSLRNLARGGLFIAPVACHLLWRKSYYGKWLPNTLSAKTGNVTQQLAGGWDYFTGYVDHEGPALYLVVFGLAAAVLWRNRWALAAAAIWVFGASYTILVGGDWMPIFRFMSPLQPFLFLLIGLGLREIVEKKSRLFNYGLLLLAIAIVADRSLTLRDDRRVVLNQEKRFWDMAAGGVSRWFDAQMAKRGRDDVAGTIAMGDIGQIGYETDFPVLDLLGLVEPVIAELPGGYTTKVGPGFRDRFFEVEPRYVVLISSDNDCNHPSVIGSRVIYNDPRFSRSYAESGRVRLDQGFFWCIYEHKRSWDADNVTKEPARLPRGFKASPGLQ